MSAAAATEALRVVLIDILLSFFQIIKRIYPPETNLRAQFFASLIEHLSSTSNANYLFSYNSYDNHFQQQTK